MKRVYIADTTLVSSDSLSFRENIEIARQLEKLKVDIIELPQCIKSAKDILFVKTISAFIENAVLSVDAGYTKEDVIQSAAALSSTKKPRLRICLPVSCVGMEYSFHKKGPAMIKMITELVSAAKECCPDVEFCALDATRADESVLKDAITAAISAGADTVCVCDDEGIMLPSEICAFAGKVKGWCGDKITLGLCVSNSSSMAVASSIEALDLHVSLIKTSQNGSISPLDSTISAIRKNLFRFESGINFTSAGKIISNSLQTSCTAKEIAEKTNDADAQLLLDANDSVEDVSKAVSALGYDLNEDDTKSVYEEFCRVAQKKKINAVEMEAIIASVASSVPATYTVEQYSIHSVNTMLSSAQIVIKKGGEALEGVSLGDGPIDASFKAINQIVGRHFELDDFQIQSITRGHEAMGNAVVKLRADGKLYSGNGLSTDIIGASIRAYVNALNKIVFEEDER